jgi:hypothetical protein
MQRELPEIVAAFNQEFSVDGNFAAPLAAAISLGRVLKSAMSAYPPTAAQKRTLHEVREGPFPDSCTAANNEYYSINSSARFEQLSCDSEAA